MTRPAPELDPVRRTTDHPLEHLSVQERAVFDVLATDRGRVISRAELARRAGLNDLSARRCDSLIVGIRRRLGAERIRTVRRRGWMLVR